MLYKAPLVLFLLSQTDLLTKRLETPCYRRVVIVHGIIWILMAAYTFNISSGLPIKTLYQAESKVPGNFGGLSNIENRAPSDSSSVAL